MHEHRDSLRKFPTPRTPLQGLGGVEHFPHADESAILPGGLDGIVEPLPCCDLFGRGREMVLKTVLFANKNHTTSNVVYILYPKK